YRRSDHGRLFAKPRSSANPPGGIVSDDYEVVVVSSPNRDRVRIRDLGRAGSILEVRSSLRQTEIECEGGEPDTIASGVGSSLTTREIERSSTLGAARRTELPVA